MGTMLRSRALFQIRAGIVIASPIVVMMRLISELSLRGLVRLEGIKVTIKRIETCYLYHLLQNSSTRAMITVRGTTHSMRLSRIWKM